jgi:hypothetical protein
VSTQPLTWRDDGTTMTWDHFSWDAVVFTPTTMKNLKLGFGKKDAVVLQVTDSVIAGATGNAALANPPITLAELGTLKTTAATAITDETQAREACLLAHTERVNAVDALRVGLKQYATYAYSMLGGDKAAMQALGLDVVEGGAVLGVLPAPGNVRSRRGPLEGSVSVRWAAVRGRLVYKVEQAEEVNGPWTVVYEGGRAQTLIGGLVSGKEYFFRTRCVGASGPGAVSDITKTRAA